MLEDNHKYIAVSDLHIGLEAELLAKGVSMSSLTPAMADKLLQLVGQEHADTVLLLGDIKHTLGSINKQEWDEIPPFLKRLTTKAEVYLVPGNHDGNIRHLLPASVNAVSAKGMTLGDTLFVHGHSMPSDMRSNVGRIVMGHVHPVFVKKGSVVHGQRVWIYIQARKDALFASGEGLVEIVVMPSFNPHLYATGGHYRKSISPIITRVTQGCAVEKCIVATLDGSVVGDARVLPNIL